MDRRETFGLLLAVWNGDDGVDAIDSLVTDAYRGHLGSRDRDAAQLKDDIGAYRRRLPDVRFTAEHQFADGDFLATRLTASARGQTITGLNISRWENERLAEEWAVWETFPD